MANVFDAELRVDEDDPPGFKTRYAQLGIEAGSERLGATLYEVPAGEAL